MRAAILHKPGDIRIEDMPLTKIKDDEVLVKVHSCGICGTDFHVFKGDREINFPLIQGHEISGEIVEVGNSVDKNLLNKRVAVEPNFTCGKCYYCRTGRFILCSQRQTLGITLPGGFAEYVKVPQNYVWTIKDNISYEEGALVETLTVGYHAVIRADVKLGNKVVVFGLGAVGLSVVQFARQSGAQVCAIDLVDERLQLAKELGAEVLFNPAKEGKDLDGKINEWSNGFVNIVFEATGVPKVQEQALNIVMAGGKLVIVGQSSNPMRVPSLLVSRREIEIVGTLACLFDFPTVIDLLERNIVKAKPLITHTFKLAQLQDAYKVIENQEAIKVVINCQQ